MNTIEKLNQLAELKSAVDALNIKKQALIESVLTPEIKQQLAEIDAEFAPEYEAVSEKTAVLEQEIKTDVVQAGETVKGDHLMAVFNKGRVSWDTKGLEGVLALIPEIEKFRKEGDPSVSIRAR
jgi:hypothetical protein